MYYMKVVMDADCLIKLTKAKLKEKVCSSFAVIIPQRVKEEVVDQGKSHPDSVMVRENLDKGRLTISRAGGVEQKGEEAVLAVFRQGGFEAVCSDDKKFIKKLRLFDVPYLTPAVFIPVMMKKGMLEGKEAHERLKALSPFISEDEYSIVKLKLDSMLCR